MAVSSYVGEQVRIQRERRGLSQEQLADWMRMMRLRWTRHTVGDAESGARKITVDELVAIGIILDVEAWATLGELHV